jgi:hypothetical protein
VSVDVSEEIFSSSGVLEGGREKLMKLVIICVKRVYFAVKIVFQLIHIIFFFLEVIQALLDVLKLSQMLLVLHIFYIQHNAQYIYISLFLFISDAITYKKYEGLI